MVRYCLLFYAVMSAIAFVAYAADKRKAKKKAWRTPESVLLGLGFFGGAVGALLGMYLFRHKTRHFCFWLVNIIGLAAQTALLYLLCIY